MSYCVNCGVELAPSEKHCPLCGVEVINPAQPAPENPWQPYPHREDPMVERINRRFISIVITIALAFPMAICLAIDYTYPSSKSGQLHWSLYVSGALAMLWFWLIPSLLFKKAHFLMIMLPISGSLLGFLLLIEYLTPRNVTWFLPLALPLVLILTLLASTVALLIRHKKIRGFAIPGALLIASGLQAAGTDFFIKLFRTQQSNLSWSWFVLLPCLAVAAVFMAIARRQKVRTEILKRLHL